MSKINGFLIAAPQSGSGKTTVSLAIMAALCRRGLTVAPFKCGPDFIDPGYHRIVTGRASINVDGWMCPEEFVNDTFLASHNNLISPINPIGPIAIIEGAMGLFDGIGPSSREGSSAQIAAITGTPVVLVVNARGMAASAAALVAGFAAFDPKVRLAGVIFNNVGSDSHAAMLKEALAAHCPETYCFGCIPRDELLTIPSRHLGLVTAEDNPLTDEFITRLANMAESCLDIDRLVELSILADNLAMPPHPPPDLPLEGGGTKSSKVAIVLPELETSEQVPSLSRGGSGRGWGESIRIAVARDTAFCFTYDDNLRLLREAGAEITFFSPLKDVALPSGIQGIYLPGGYPELYAGELAANSGMKEAIRSAVAGNMPVYAECGGFIYLTEGLDASENQPEVELVGIFPVRARMLSRRKALGYRQVTLVTGTLIGGEGYICRGHEFHYSEINSMPDGIERCYRVSRQGAELGMEGYRIRNCLASYIHLHFGSNPEIASAFVDSCRRYSLPVRTGCF